MAKMKKLGLIFFALMLLPKAGQTLTVTHEMKTLIGVFDACEETFSYAFYRDTDCDINTLEVEGYDIKFDPNVLEYKLKIKDEYSLKINIELVNTESKYTIKGNQNLQNGSNIIIEVRNGAKTKKYTITIEKDIVPVVKKKTSPLLIISLVVLGLGIVGLIVFLIIKNKKKKNKEELEKTKDLDNVLESDSEEDEDIDTDEEIDESDDDSSLEDDFDLSDK